MHNEFRGINFFAEISAVSATTAAADPGKSSATATAAHRAAAHRHWHKDRKQSAATDTPTRTPRGGAGT
jgi:hypothetical protein